MPDVTCAGVLVADVIVRPVDTWPDRGRLSLVQSIVLRSGGLAHTTGVTLAKLGVQTAVVGRVGTDVFGDFLVAVLVDHGVQPHVLREAEIPTSATVVAVAGSGERSFLHLVGANANLQARDIPDELLRTSRVFHLGGYFVLPGVDGEPAAALLRRAREQGCRTSLDMTWDAQGRWMTLLAPCLPYVDFLFGNQDELSQVTGLHDPVQIASALHSSGAETVAVKMGEAGAYVDSPAWRHRVPAYVVEVVDTTGAGDAYCGGFLTGILAGWTMDRVASFANAVGAMCVTAVGGTTGVGTRDETLRFMERAAIRESRPRA
ncbi:MAG TPA: carbohydrate kinase family protein [bacterium]|nr:carbohydrate kinase family protein [bacterium]